MNIYSVYSDSSKKSNNPIFIRNGFSFIASIFNFFWALYHRMWSLTLFIFVLDLLTRSYVDSYIAYLINIAILFLFGFFASDLQEYYAKKKDYSLDDIILAADEEEAEVKYYLRSSITQENEKHV